jgi:hypothetical protein
MAKVIALVLLAAMLIQIIKPLGLPGFRKRADFWKIAVVALAAMMLTTLVRGRAEARRSRPPRYCSRITAARSRSMRNNSPKAPAPP